MSYISIVMIDKQTNTTKMTNLISELRIYIGETINYKNYTLRISEVSRNGVTMFDPNTGLRATISLEKAYEIIRLKNVTA